MHFIVNDLHIRCDGHEIEELVADNEGYYRAYFEFDSAWAGLAKTARFTCNEGYYDALIGLDDSCIIPSEVMHTPGLLYVGVYAGEYGKSLLTTTPASMRLVKSILTESMAGLPDDPDPAIYTQIVNTAMDALRMATDVQQRADNGDFNGKDGKDGTITDIDQTYAPLSENPQSGTAVAQAIEQVKLYLSNQLITALNTEV